MADTPSRSKKEQVKRAQRLREQIERLKRGRPEEETAGRSLREQIEKRAAEKGSNSPRRHGEELNHWVIGSLSHCPAQYLIVEKQLSWLSRPPNVCLDLPASFNTVHLINGAGIRGGLAVARNK